MIDALLLYIHANRHMEICFFCPGGKMKENLREEISDFQNVIMV